MNEKSKKKTGKTGLFVSIAVFAVVVVFLLTFKNKLSSFFDPVSIVASAATANLKETDGRTNVLILGSDKRTVGEVTSVLTDTILVASIGKLDNDVVMISLPRDLWIQTPSGHRGKINEIYTYKGINELVLTIQEILGLQIHYYGLVTFDIFQETVDALGGIDINVDTAFTDHYYPVQGKESDMCGRTQTEIENMVLAEKSLLEMYPCRYETIKFETGKQDMNGTTALKFARSRHGDNEEGNDFARAKRQQKVISAIKEKALSVKTVFDLNKIKELYDIYSKNVDTNIDLNAIQGFYVLYQQLDFSGVRSIVLDDRSEADAGGLLYAPEDTKLYGGLYVLIPRTGDYSQIHAYVQKYLFGNK